MLQDAPETMPLQPGPDCSPPIGTSIQVAADLLMDLVANEREEAKQESDIRLVHLTNYVEDYKRSTRQGRAADAQNLASAHKQIQDLEQRLSELQDLKRADEGMLRDLSGQIHSLQQERMYLHAELSSFNGQSGVSHNSPLLPADMISDLARYGIMYYGQNALSFGEQWLHLWNQYVSDEPHDPGLSPSDRITPKELIILLENFSNQVRKDRNTIQSQRQTITDLERERAYLFELCNKDPKQELYPAAVEVAVHVPTSQLSRSYSYTENQGVQDGEIAAVKTEPSPDFYSSPASYASFDSTHPS